MSFLKPDAPPAPDYAAAAQQQGVANRETAIANNALNRVNQYTPQGSLVWTMRPGADPNNPQVGDYTQTVSLSPDQQALYNYNQQLNTQLMQMAGGQLSRVQSAFDSPVSTAGLPGWQTSHGRAPQVLTTQTPPAPAAAPRAQSTASNQMQSPTGGSALAPAGAAATSQQGGLKPTTPPTPTAAAAPTAFSPMASEADRLARNQQELWQRQQDREAARAGTRLQGTYIAPDAPGQVGTVNQPLVYAISDGGQFSNAVGPVDQYFPMAGARPATSAPASGGSVGATSGGSSGGGFTTGGGSTGGSTGGFSGAFGAGAVPSAVDDTSRQRVEQAILSRLEPQYQQDEARMRNQLLSQGLEVGTPAYAAELDRLARAQNDARMQAVLAGGTEESRQVGLNANLQNQAFTQGLQGSQFDNQTRQQMLAELMYMRNLPLNELNALRSGGQVSMPTFGSYYTNNAGAAPIFDAAGAQSNYNMGVYNGQVSGSNALLGGLGALGAAYLSDIRLKTNIQRIGDHPAGVGRYSWDWIDGSGGETGVIAQELQAVVPSAVVRHPSGWLMVNYDAIGGR